MANIKSVSLNNLSYVNSKKDKVIKTVYPRVHMFSFDLSIFQGNMSSGSMGFTLFSQPTTITIEKGDVDEIIGIRSSLKDEITKYLEILRSNLHIPASNHHLRITIQIPDKFRHHTGLGLTTQITGMTILAAAELYGINISPRDLFNMGIGRVSALGISLLYNPGFILEFGYKIDDTNHISAHPDLYEYKESPSGSMLEILELPWRAVVAIPKEGTSLSGKIEDDFWNNIFPDKVESSQVVSYAVLNYIIPAMVSNDFNNFIEGLTLATESGTKPAEELIQAQETKDMLSEMRAVFGFAAISSMGPTVFSFVKDNEFDTLASKINNNKFDLFCIDLNKPTNHNDSIQVTIPSEIIKNNEQKYFFEDKNIPYDKLNEKDKKRLKQKIELGYKGKKSKIIASFACLGKTYFANKYPDQAIDMESLTFRYESDIANEGIKSDINLKHNKLFPQNYIDNIVNNIGKYDYIFVVLSIPALKMLDDLDVQYSILYPDTSMLDVIIKRSKDRGNNDAMINLLHNNLVNNSEISLLKSILKCDNYIYMKGDDYIENLIERGAI